MLGNECVTLWQLVFQLLKTLWDRCVGVLSFKLVSIMSSALKQALVYQRDSAAAKPVGGFIQAIQNSYPRDKQNNGSKSVTFDYNLHCSLLPLHFKVTCTQGTRLNQKLLYNARQCFSTTALPLSSLRCSTASVLIYPSAWVLSKPQGSSCTPPWMESFKKCSCQII